MRNPKIATWAVVLLLTSTSFAQEGTAPQLPLPDSREAPGCAPVPTEPIGFCPAPACPRFWASGEYLLWWIDKGPAPVPLATTAPTTSQAFTPGALGNPDTTVVLGGQPIDHSLHHGARFTAGFWLDDRQQLALEGNYLFLANRSVTQSVAVNNAPDSIYLVNPFFDPSVGFEEANFLADPGPFGTSGAAALTMRSRVQGAECNVLANALNTCNARVHLLAGFRFLQLQEGLTLATTQTDPNASFFPGQFVDTIDEFSTRNNFYGGQLGARLDWTRGRLFVQTTAKVALGSTHEILDVKGYTRTNTGPDFASEIPVTTVPGGIYAQPTNIGLQSRDRFAVAPEVTIQVGVNLGRSTRAFVGYNFLYLSEVVRPGNQIDGSINSTQLVSFTGVPSGPLVGEARPAPLFKDADFWAQGMNFGLSFSW